MRAEDLPAGDYEVCRNCEGAGACRVGKAGGTYICPVCDGASLVPHVCRIEGIADDVFGTAPTPPPATVRSTLSDLLRRGR